jgi:SAM-dependent methyltransferase
MVRTVRSMEEEARVQRVSGLGIDSVLSDSGLLDALEGRTIDTLIAWAADGTRRALVVGLEDEGRIALALAKAGLFVTVAEPDEARIERLRAAADEARCGIRLNFYATDYMKKEFTSSGFDVAILFSTLSRYNEPLVVLKKAARELRAGGRVFARLRVRPSLAPVRDLVARLPKGDLLANRVEQYALRIPAVARVVAIPDDRGFLEDVGEVFKVEKVERVHLAAPAVAWLSRNAPRGRDLAAKAFPHALRLDETLFARVPAARNLATYVLFWGTKELGLGKTFRV